MLGFDIYSANPCLLHPIRCLVKQLQIHQIIQKLLSYPWCMYCLVRHKTTILCLLRHKTTKLCLLRHETTILCLLRHKTTKLCGDSTYDWHLDTANDSEQQIQEMPTWIKKNKEEYTVLLPSNIRLLTSTVLVKCRNLLMTL